MKIKGTIEVEIDIKDKEAQEFIKETILMMGEENYLNNFRINLTKKLNEEFGGDNEQEGTKFQNCNLSLEI
ncbi:hypothetical protein [Tepidibacter hydrothermalis]|uniref:Uncharacterized protein n=1 Tax=Tepidibacter hydrothermalis TaxID=3036126 RepID=A0ABY8E777_9FIRM|nr:hypothetical protein [Tepidibacter hydrothermalis]WFD08733.1 hypothetical protein P4S50_10020 [Tepidibacter hydrothermalis]